MNVMSPANVARVSSVLLATGCQAHPRLVEAAPDAGVAPPPAVSAAPAKSTPETDGGPRASAAEPPQKWFAVAEDAASGRACRFGGVVRAMETLAVPHGRKGAKRAVRMTLEGGAAGCHDAELAGVQTSISVGPLADAWSESPCARIVLGVPAGWTLPFGRGDAVCGSVRGYGLGYDRGGEAVVVYPSGELLVAFADAMPRTPSPLPGFRFTLGPERSNTRMDEGYLFAEHDMVIAHDKARWTVRADAPPSSWGGDRGPRFRVEASGYRTRGALPPWMAWLHDAGYGFAVAREAAP